MSVSMRSHSMLLWYSNFRVVRLPSSPATRTLAQARLPRNFQIDSWRLSSRTAHVRSVRKTLCPTGRPTPARYGVAGPEFCTCALLHSEASRPKKGRRTGCVAAGRGDHARGCALGSLYWVYACANVGGEAGREGAWRVSGLGWSRL